MHQWAVDLVMNKYPDIGDHYAVVDSKTQKVINTTYLQKGSTKCNISFQIRPTIQRQLDPIRR